METYFYLTHPKIGRVKNLFNTEYEAKKHLTHPKGQLVHQKVVDNAWAKFEKLGWKCGSVNINVDSTIEFDDIIRQAKNNIIRACIDAGIANKK